MRIMRFERACCRKLAKFVPHHVFGYVNGEKVLSVVYGEIETDEIRGDRGTPGPSLDGLAIATCLCL